MKLEPQKFKGQSFSLGEFHHLKWPLRETFLSVCQKFPNASALTCLGNGASREITYSTLRDDLSQALRGLDQKVPENKTIVTLAGNHYEHVVTLLAVLFSGRRLCPVNPIEPPAQVNRRLDLLPDTFLIADERYQGRSDFAMKDLFNGSSGAKDAWPEQTFSRDLTDDAVYIFSSGSTGQSKIIRQTEAMILTNVEALIQHHQLDRQRRSIATPLPLFHVNALEFSLLSTLLTGGELILFEHFDPDKLLQTLESRKIDIASLIPPMIQLLLERTRSTSSFKNLGYVVSAATALPKTIAQDFLNRTGVRIIQGYGLSEAVNFSCVTPIDLNLESYEQVMFAENYPTIGTAIWGNEVEILSENGQPQAERQTGEIALRGWNVMPGYFSANQTREEFRHGYLLTGDLGYWVSHEQKKFYFISGRAKDCIKRAGETIPLRDIDDFVAGLRIEGFDAIAVPYPHTLLGEDFGLICRAGTQTPSDWNAQLIEAFKTGFSPAMRPKKYETTNEALRTESGKPRRWKFTSRFTSTN